MVKIQIHKTEARIEGWEWSCDDPLLKRWLESLRDPLGPSGADPYPDLTLAKIAVDKLGGEILSFDPPSEVREGVVY